MREVTNWNNSNHTYIVDNSQSKLLGYIPEGKKKRIMFELPMSFSNSKRKFEIIERIDDNESNVTKITSESGNVYYVKNEDGHYSCSCIGFKYHGKCKHINQVMSQ